MRRNNLVILIIVCCLVISSMSFSFAEDIQSESDYANNREKVSAICTSILYAIENQKEMYGLENVDFSKLYIGEAFNVYEVSSINLLIPVTSVVYYPIFYLNEWVTTAVASLDNENRLNVQLVPDFSIAYNNSSAVSNNIAIVFDDYGSFIVSDGLIIKVADAPFYNSSRRKSIFDCELYVNYKSLNDSDSLAIAFNIFSGRQSHRDSFDTQYYIYPPIVHQDPTTLQCWAACIASIRTYYGNTTTIDDVYEYLGITKYNGANLWDVSNALDTYGESYTLYTQNWGVPLSWYQLRYEICYNNSPFYTGCSYLDSNNVLHAHAVVIRGYYVNQYASELGIISYMDPISSYNYYYASSVATDYNFYYVPVGSLSQFYMDYFLAVHD